jgi:PAS domain S-box-containing protein
MKDLSGTKQKIQKLEKTETAYKTTQEALRASEDNFRRSLDESPLGVRIVTTKGETLYANRAILDFYGYDSIEELKTTTVEKRYTKESIAEYQIRQKKRKCGVDSPSEYEISINRKNGEIRHLQVYRKEILWNGKMQYQAIYQDITERKKAEGALRKSEGKYRSLLDNASDAIFLAEIEGTILETNKKGEQLLGYSKEELSGIHISRIHPKEVFEKINNTFQKMAIEESSFINDVSVLRKDGKLVPVDITGSLVEQDGKKILLGIFRDITERKRAEDELLDSIQRNAALLNANPDMFFVFSDDGRFIDAKAEHSDRFHVPPSDFLGKRIKDILPPDLAQQTIDHIAAAKQTGRLVQYNYTLGMNGEPRDFEARLVPCENGTFMAVVRDITERKQATEALRQNEERYRMLVENASDIIFRTDNTGHFTFVNPSALSITGYKEEEVIGMHYPALIRADMRDEAVKFFGHQFVKRLHNTYSEYPTIKKDGHEVWFGQNTQLIVEDGNITGFQSVARDITDRKRVEDALRESEERYRSILEEMEEAYYEVDLKGNFTFFNESLCKTLGYSRVELMGMNNRAYTSPEHARKAFLAFNEIYQTGSPKAMIDYEIIRKDGGKRFLETSILPIKNPSGKIIRFRGVSRDITDRKQAEDDLKVSEINLRMILDSVDNAIFIYTEDGKIIDVNSKMLEMYRVSREEVCSMSIEDDFSTPDNPLNELPGIWESVMNGEKRLFEWQARRPHDGATFNAEVFLRKINLNNGEFILAAVRDITDRKKSEEKLQNTMEILRKAVGTTIQVLVSAIETRDPYTAGHQVRSANLARTIATEMGLSQEKIEGIRMAGSIHDIGKLSIPAEILSKPTKLSEIEFSLIKEHALQGYEMLKNVESPWPLAEIVYQHHERIDGSGYPRNLKGNDILIEAHILSVADVVEAMASHRPYRPSLGLYAALDEIEKNRVTFYDGAVVDACLRLFREKGYQLECT